MTDSIFTKLAAPFPPERISWRVGSTNRRRWEEARKANAELPKRRGQALCYIDARDVMERLDATMGAHWQTECVPMHNGSMCCRIGLLIEGDWLWRADGAGPTGDVGDPQQREMAIKGGYSDAFKRAAVQWGIGRYLYDIDAGWIDLDDYWAIPKDAYSRLEALLRGEKLKSARQARKDGDYHRIEALLRTCKTIKALGTLWKTEQAKIATWPEGWRAAITEEKDRLKARLEEGVAA